MTRRGMLASLAGAPVAAKAAKSKRGGTVTVSWKAPRSASEPPGKLYAFVGMNAAQYQRVLESNGRAAEWKEIETCPKPQS